MAWIMANGQKNKEKNRYKLYNIDYILIIKSPRIQYNFESSIELNCILNAYRH